MVRPNNGSTGSLKAMAAQGLKVAIHSKRTASEGDNAQRKNTKI
jgi:hypothetical protein